MVLTWRVATRLAPLVRCLRMLFWWHTLVKLKKKHYVHGLLEAVQVRGGPTRINTAMPFYCREPSGWKATVGAVEGSSMVPALSCCFKGQKSLHSHIYAGLARVPLLSTEGGRTRQPIWVSHEQVQQMSNHQPWIQQMTFKIKKKAMGFFKKNTHSKSLRHYSSFYSQTAKTHQGVNLR